MKMLNSFIDTFSKSQLNTYNRQGELQSEITKLPNGDKISSIISGAFDPAGHILLADSQEEQVLVLSQDGSSIVAKLPIKPKFAYKMRFYRNKLYVLDADSQIDSYIRVYKYNL